MYLDIYRNNAIVAAIPVSENSNYSYQLMGEHKVACESIVVTDVLDIQLGDYILYKGQKYYINTAPGCTKFSNFSYEYSLTFEHVSYRLFDKKLMQNGEFVTDFFGYPKLYLQLIVDNMNQIDTGWRVGNVAEADEKHIAFEEGASCRAALTTVAEEFGLEYYFEGKTVHLVKYAGAITSHVFSQGKGNGLYTFQLQRRDDANLVTRVYGRGGTRNIPADYRLNDAGIPATRIRIPSDYVEQNVELYGIKEGSYINEEIFPNRTATLTGVGGIGTNVFYITDATLEFNINDHLLEGLDAKVAFKSGDLAGYEFTISKYDDSSKTLTLNIDKNQPDFAIPNATFVPKAGDKYTLVDIDMPQEYVAVAETELQAKTEEYAAENSRPKLAFSLTLDEQYVRSQGVRLVPGDRVRVAEPKLGVDAMIRTTSVSWPLLHEDRISATIADYITYTRQQRLVAETIENRKETIIQERINAERARRTARELRQLRGLIRDPDDYFDITGIRPGTIETLYLAVGAKSQNFGLNNVLIQANYRGNPNSVHISSGQLVHYEVEIEGLGYVWQMPERQFTGLDPAKAYYIAAKVERTALRGVWSLTEDFKAAEQEPGVWYFNLGVLYPAKDGYRNYDLTKGMTTIVGDTITTGKLQSIDKINFFNLTNGTFNLGNGERGIDWGITNEGQLTIRGAVMADKVEVGSEGVVNAFISGLTDNGPLSVRFSAGASGEFRVLDNGDVYMRRAEIQDGCKVGSFTIEGGGMSNSDGNGSIYIGEASRDTEIRIGVNIFPYLADTTGTAYFSNGKSNPGGTNYGILAAARGGKNNIAARFNGGLQVTGGLYYQPQRITTGGRYTLGRDASHVVWAASADGSLLLPKDPLPGHRITFYKYNTGPTVGIVGNGRTIVFGGQGQPAFLSGVWHELYFDGTNWNMK
ncbi:phage tail protein [Pontibacter sp. 172403-2]|uniref:phage tail protein n=1 Tax=Pontibacter rufus TaxID=2791028 RepID=UPI0018AFD9D7|nr:phage tail protein [Pontibacter sp. 172403-2]MBF9252491.1 phage tail protein [Pontibacter sp. 172403-2]